MAIVSPSVLSCDFGNLQKAVEMLDSSNAEWIHVDVMDGVFVPNISFGFPVLSTIRNHTSKLLDVHLMITNPDAYLTDFCSSGANIITVHYEACTHLHRTLSEIKRLGMKAGVALNPHTPVSVLQDIITEVDLVLIMSVNPGFGGQKFIASSVEKVIKLKKLIREKNTHTLIEVDGGINLENGRLLVEAGADALVAGSFVFGSSSPVETIKSLGELS